jgi:RNA polymerase sigma-70 factor (ECF subfamily)
MLGASPDVQDVVQDVFLSACRNLGSFRGDSSLAAWLTIITFNQCRTFLRKRALQRTMLAEWQRHQGRPAAPELAGGTAEAERGDRVRQAVAGLKTPLREVIVLRYLQGLPTVEVADALGVSVPAVKVRLHRARARLRDMLAANAEE